jgi:hypothetical protein
MQMIGQITKIDRVSEGERPQMGPISTIPFQIEVQTSAGPSVLEISQTAALELVEELSKRLRVRGCL